MPEPAARQLAVLMAGERVGTITQGRAGQYSLEYDDEWRSTPHATPLSLSMPMARRTHPDDAVRPFL